MHTVCHWLGDVFFVVAAFFHRISIACYERAEEEENKD